MMPALHQIAIWNSPAEMELADNLTDAHPPGLPIPNRMHGFVTLDRAIGSPERAETLARSHLPLDSPMILLQNVIQVFRYCTCLNRHRRRNVSSEFNTSMTGG
jgi:hypothetical protein